MAHSTSSSDQDKIPDMSSQPTLAQLYASLATKDSELKTLHAHKVALCSILDVEYEWSNQIPELKCRVKQELAQARSLVRITELMTESYREWANELSRSTIRKLSILDLPDELLIRVFEEVEDCRPSEIQPYTWNRALDDIRAVRLTCRRFYNASSHLLIHDVHVQIDQPSLDHLDRIANHPALGRGVRAVVVKCHLFFPEPANAMEHFSPWAQLSFNRAARSDDPDYPIDQSEGYHGWDEEAMNNHQDWRAVVASYDSCVEAPHVPHLLDDDPYKRYHWKLMVEAHEDYQRRFCEQQRLISSGSYASSLAGLVARLPSARHLVLTDRIIQRPERWRKCSRRRRDLINDDEWLKQQFVLPLSHAETTLPPRWFHLPQDILIRLGERGVHLRRLDVDLYVTLLAAPSSTPPEECRDKVSALVLRLKQLSIILKGVRHHEPAFEQLRDVTGLMRVLLSAPSCLEKVSVSRPFPSERNWIGILLGSMISRRASSRPQELSLSGCEFDMPDLQALMDRLGPSTWVTHENTFIRGGSWAKALDVLRLWRQDASSSARLSVSRPRGGDLDVEGDDWNLPMGGKMGHEELRDQLWAYVNGVIAQNPFISECAEVS